MLNRRRFIVGGLTSTGALVLGIPLSFASEGETPLPDGAVGAAANGERQLGYFITITPDNRVIIGNNQPEIGQGIRTSLPLLVAEELEVPMAQVEVTQLPLGLVRDADGMRWRYGGQGVGGSTGLTSNWVFMREVGARARQLLLQAAAERWEVDLDSVKAQEGYVLSAKGHRASYGELVTAAARLPMPETAPVLKDLREFRVAGQHHNTLDAKDIVTGKVKYGLDTFVPGMKVAMIVRSPHLDGTVKSFDASQALKLAGVHAVFAVKGPEVGAPYHILANGVAVVADDTWTAIKARRALKVEWHKGPFADESTESFDRQAEKLLQGQGQIVRSDGDFSQAFANSQQIVQARYEVPYVSHAPLEPQNCFAHVYSDEDGERCDVVVPTQMPSAVSRSVAGVTGIDRMRIEVEMTRVGGGFGRRLTTDYAAEAALISKHSGHPIKLVWTREDDLQHDFYRPAGHHDMKAGLDESGFPVAWTQRLASASKYYRRPNMADDKLWEAELYPDDFPASIVPNYQLEYFPVTSGVPRGSWRAPAHTANAFAVQVFVDEIAHHIGADPLAYKLKLLGDNRDLKYEGHGGPVYNPGRQARLLAFVADEIGYGKERPAGRGIGLASHFTFGGYMAHAMEVSVAGGELVIHRIVGAIDCGFAVNPNAVEAQIQGGTVDGLSTALNLQITVAGGQIQQTNFHNYQLLGMSGVPVQVDMHILNYDENPTGVGEIAIPTVAPALVNAIFAASGQRIRRLPVLDQLRRKHLLVG